MKWRQDSCVFYVTRNDTADVKVKEVKVRSTGYGKQRVTSMFVPLMAVNYQLVLFSVEKGYVRTRRSVKTLLCLHINGWITADLMEDALELSVTHQSHQSLTLVAYNYLKNDRLNLGGTIVTWL
jgi:hypothetical protein